MSCVPEKLWLKTRVAFPGSLIKLAKHNISFVGYQSRHFENRSHQPL